MFFRLMLCLGQALLGEMNWESQNGFPFSDAGRTRRSRAMVYTMNVSILVWGVPMFVLAPPGQLVRLTGSEPGRFPARFSAWSGGGECGQGSTWIPGPTWFQKNTHPLVLSTQHDLEEEGDALLP